MLARCGSSARRRTARGDAGRSGGRRACRSPGAARRAGRGPRPWRRRGRARRCSGWSRTRPKRRARRPAPRGTQAGNGSSGSASSDSAAASSPTVLWPRRRRSETATHQRSRSACACAGVDTGAERHHDCVTIVDRLLDHPLALRPARRADRDLNAVVLGHRRRLGPQPVASRVDERRHPVGPPRAGGAAQPAQHAVQRLGQVREALTLAEAAAQLPRVRQRADQHVRLRAPRRLGQLQPVQLQLLARLVLEPDRELHPAGLAALAHRPQPQLADLAHQRRVGAIEPQPDAAPHTASSPARARRRRTAPSDTAGTAQDSSAPAPATGPAPPGTSRPSCDPGRCAGRSPRPTSPGERARESPHHPPGSTSPTGLLVIDGVNTATIEGAPTEPRARGSTPARPSGLASVEPRARSPYALPPWGILVIRCEEKTVIADSGAGGALERETLGDSAGPDAGRRDVQQPDRCVVRVRDHVYRRSELRPEATRGALEGVAANRNSRHARNRVAAVASGLVATASEPLGRGRDCPLSIISTADRRTQCGECRGSPHAKALGFTCYRFRGPRRTHRGIARFERGRDFARGWE